MSTPGRAGFGRRAYGEKSYNKRVKTPIHLKNIVLRPARPGEGKTAGRLVEARVGWMEEKGIEQWPRKHYLAVYNPAYFEAAARRGELWVLEESGRILACAVILSRDERWRGREDASAWYVHNLASVPGAAGAGEMFLRLIEKEARRRKKCYLRLDCKTGARKINAYYREKGFRFAGYWGCPEYRGNLRQKKLIAGEEE